MKKFSYLITYHAKTVEGENLYGNIHLTTEKKLKHEDMFETRVEIIKNSKKNILVTSVIITSIFCFGKVKIKV